MKQSDMERMFGAPIMVGMARRTGVAWSFRAKVRNLWCARCARTFPNGVYRDEAGLHRCPYGDCDAPEADAQPWPAIRVARPNYPEHPTLGIRYPLAEQEQACP